MKPEARSVSFDDGSFSKGDREVIVIGTVLRGNSVLEGVLSTKVSVDGTDSTERLESLLTRSKHLPQLRCVFLDGIALGGFNTVDIKALSKAVKLPVITVSRHEPDMAAIREALKNLPGGERRYALMQSAGPMQSFKSLHFQCTGCTAQEAQELIANSLNRGSLPEGIRMAHLIATGVSRGESTAHP